MLDLVVIAVVALGTFAGWRRGFIVPLIAVGTSLAGLYALFAGPGAGLLPSGIAGIGLGVLVVGIASAFVVRIASAIASLVYRVGFLKHADHVLGVPLGALTALVPVYVGLVALVSFDGVLAPFHGKPTVDQAAVAALRAAVAANPQFGVMIDAGTLDALAAQVATSAIPRDQLATINQTLAFYESDVRPQLLGSTLAPLIVGIGERAPIVGRHVDFPTR